MLKKRFCMFLMLLSICLAVLGTGLAYIPEYNSGACIIPHKDLLEMDPMDALNLLLDFHLDVCMIQGWDEKNAEKIASDRPDDSWQDSQDHLDEYNPIDKPYKPPKQSSPRRRDISDDLAIDENHDGDEIIGSPNYILHHSTHDSPINTSKQSGAGSSRNNGVDQRVELIKIFNSTQGDNWIKKSGWNTTRPICEWYGVSCDRKCRSTTIEQNRCPVITLRLDSNNLRGPIPNVELPGLQNLYLSQNQLIGNLPNFTGMPNLNYLSVNDNKMSGSIPAFNNLLNLGILTMGNNHFTGSLPRFINLPALSILDMADNQIHGALPTFSDHPALSSLIIFNNMFNDSVSDIADLPNLLEMIAYLNNLQGTVPDFRKLPNLSILTFSFNELNGTLPDFSGLQSVSQMDFSNNYLEGTIPNFTKLQSLSILDLSTNLLIGTIPDFQFLRAINAIVLMNNQLNGTVPKFTKQPGLAWIYLSNNILTGTVHDFSSTPRLSRLNLDDNFLSGQVPGFSTSQSLGELYLANNFFQGTIPSFANSPALSVIDLSGNSLNGSIPELRLSNLASFDLHGNKLDGSISTDLDLAKIEYLDLSFNHLRGEVPISIEKMTKLKFVYLSHNNLSGSMPSSFWNFVNLFEVNLGHNHFSGNIQDFLCPLRGASNYYYKFLNLEANEISGNLDWEIYEIRRLVELNLKDNRISSIEELHINRLWRSLDLSGNPINSAIPDTFILFTDMLYLGLRNTTAHHQNNSLLPKFAMQTDPYNLRGRFDPYMCPSIKGDEKTVFKTIDIDPTYYNLTLCQCLPNYFGMNGMCQPCPESCECQDGMSLNNCHVSPSIQLPKLIIQCPRPSSCVHKVPDTNPHTRNQAIMENYCADGYFDRACSRCLDGYGQQGRSCVSCGKYAAQISITVWLISILGFTFYIYKWSSGNTAKFRIIMFHAQTLSILSAVITANDGFDQAVDWSLSIGSLHMPNLGCILDAAKLEHILIISFMRIPAVIIIGFVLFKILHHKRDKVRSISVYYFL
eukprot:TRINITY_DN1627_c0_g2_i2.p1 TRINITY_DN1627_c0_g2~~TRINITY_DN1627_c0_g2_i2.p1  ORF type:complete len:1019 (-),score=120.85 TRINITY_DN1627_c0_g2_i2:886-3942(-)